MGLVRFEDTRALHPKLLRAGFEARGLDEAAIEWCYFHNTDGFISEEDVALLAAGHGCKQWRRLAERLFAVGRWEVADGGWNIHDYLEHQHSKAERQAYLAAKQRAGQAGGRVSATLRARPPNEAESKQVLEQPLKQNRGSRSSKPEAAAQANAQAESGQPLKQNRSIVRERITNSSSSTTSSTARASLDDDDESEVDKALALLAERRLAVTTTVVVNPAAYRTAIVADLRKQHAERLATLPGSVSSAERIANWLEPVHRRDADPLQATASASWSNARRADEAPCEACGARGGGGYVEDGDTKTVVRCGVCNPPSGGEP